MKETWCSQSFSNVNDIVTLLLYSHLFHQNSHNIALEAHAIKASSFNGMTCTLFQKLSPERMAVAHFSPRDPDINLERQLSFKCNVTSNLSALALKVSILSRVLPVCIQLICHNL